MTANRNEIEEMDLRKSEDLCKLAEMLGYKSTGRFAINQLQCNNGAFASSLLSFFDDNPGAMEALKEWVLDNCDLDEEDDEEDDEDDNDNTEDFDDDCGI